MADKEQWVNIEQKALFKEDDVTSLERLGPKLKFECKFKKASLAHFKVRIVPQGSPASYTKKELGRNANFKLRKISAQAKPAGKKNHLSVEYALPAAGGNRFKIEAKYKGNVVEGPTTLAARRRFFYQVLHMIGVPTRPTAGLETDYWNPGKNYYVKLVQKGPVNAIKFLKTIHDNHNDFLKAAKAGYSIGNRDPWAFTLVFSNFIARQGEKHYTGPVNVTAAPRWFSLGSSGGQESVQVNIPDYIWYEMDPAHDAARAWLVANNTQFVAPDGTTIPIPSADIGVVGPAQYPLGGYKKLEIKLGPQLRYYFTSRKGTLNVDVTLKIVAGWTNGFSYNGINLVTVANNVRWQPMPANTRAYTINHEVGHKVGMVASGKGFLPNAPSTYYKDGAIDYGGHRGPHCKKGATYNAAGNYWTGAPGCVMFGANGAPAAWVAGSPSNHAPKEFCDQCEKIVRKLDLDPNRLAGFSVSVKTV